MLEREAAAGGEVSTTTPEAVVQQQGRNHHKAEHEKQVVETAGDVLDAEPKKVPPPLGSPRRLRLAPAASV